MWMLAHAAVGAAIQRGLPPIVYVPVAVLSHPVMDRVMADHAENGWEYALNAIGLVVLLLVARRYWIGALLAAVPDIEHPLVLLGILDRAYLHPLWWGSAWHESHLAVGLMQVVLVVLVIVAMVWQSEVAMVCKRFKDRRERG